MSAKRRAAKAVSGEKGKEVIIEQVLLEVQRALQNARGRTVGSGFPQLEAVTLTLQTVLTKAYGGIIKFLIFSFGKTWEKERSHEMVLTLKPPPPAPAGALSVRTIADELENAIVEAAQGVKDAVSGNPPLTLDTFNVTLSFVVTQETSGGAEFKITPVTFELKGNLKTKAIHTIELNFKK